MQQRSAVEIKVFDKDILYDVKVPIQIGGNFLLDERIRIQSHEGYPFLMELYTQNSKNRWGVETNFNCPKVYERVWNLMEKSIPIKVRKINGVFKYNPASEICALIQSMTECYENGRDVSIEFLFDSDYVLRDIKRCQWETQNRFNILLNGLFYPITVTETNFKDSDLHSIENEKRS